MNIKGKVVVITGASDGIGKEVAFKLANEGAELVLIARNQERLSEVKNRCLELGSPKVEYYLCDIATKEGVKSTVEKIINDFQALDVLINNAGIWQKVGSPEDPTLEDIEKVISTNLTGLVMITNLFVPFLRKQEEAAIINISSRSGVVAVPGESLYSASKWGVTGYTEVLKADLKGTGIKVAGIYQGGTKTSLFEKGKDPKPSEKLDIYTEPSDLADVIVFMLTRPPKIWLHDVRIEY